jgi:hypothetical protein
MKASLRSTLAAILLACLPGLACISMEEATRTQFSTDATCPLERIVVGGQMGVPPPQVVPPPKIAADPQRAALWRQQHEADAQSEASRPYFVATGCGERRVYQCVRHTCIDVSLSEAGERVLEGAPPVRH